MNDYLALPPLCCLLTLACTDQAAIPNVPDLDTLQREYDAPSAAIDTQQVSELLDQYPELERVAAAIRTTDPLLDSVDDARESADERSGSSVDLRGALTVNVVCPGSGPTPTLDAEANGSLKLELAVEGDVIKQTFWATASQCRLRGSFNGEAFPVELDGRIAIDVGSPIPLGQAWVRRSTLVSAEGTFTFGELTLRQITARFGPARFEYLQETADGSVVLLVTDEGIGLRDSDTTWFCDRETLTCASR